MYRTVDVRLWTDPRVKELDQTGKLLFVYLITNSHTHVSGLYYLLRVVMSVETGIAVAELNRVCDRVSELGLAHFDAQNELVFVVSMFRHQGSGGKNDLAAKNHIQSMHKSHLVSMFLKIYPAVAALIPDRVSDTLSIPHPSLALRTGTGSVSVSDQEQKGTVPPIPNTPPSSKHSRPNGRVSNSDPAFDLWESQFKVHRKIPYRHTTGDFVQLAELRQQLGVERPAIPEGWSRAITNYFESPLGQYSLKAFCVRYDVFLADALNEYGKPASAKSNGGGYTAFKGGDIRDDEEFGHLFDPPIAKAQIGGQELMQSDNQPQKLSRTGEAQDIHSSARYSDEEQKDASDLVSDGAGN